MPLAAESRSRYRVAIIGAGPAGCACALSLLQAGVREVLLIAAPDHDRFRIGESVPPEINPLLHELGIHEAFLQQGHQPCYGSCSYWGSNKRGYNDTIMNPHGHGWHLARNRFDRFLLQQAAARGAVLLPEARLLESQPAGEGFGLTVTLTRQAAPGRSYLEADFVVDASGGRATFARQRGSHKQADTPLVCLAAHLPWQADAPAHAGLTHLEAAPNGWWYAAHLPDQHWLLALYTDSATLKARQLQHPANWLAELGSAPHSRQLLRDSGSSMPTRLASFPAASDCLDRIAGHNWLAIGDAAASWDPLMAQGIVKAMSNGMTAARVIQGGMTWQGFEHDIHARYQHYLSIRRSFYLGEKRWPDAPFWQCMQ